MEGNGKPWEIFKTCHRGLEKKNQKCQENKSYLYMSGVQEKPDSEKRKKERKIQARIKKIISAICLNNTKLNYVKFSAR